MRNSAKIYISVAVVSVLSFGTTVYLHSPFHMSKVLLEEAAQGSAEAQYKTCLNYALGVGVSKDIAEAAKWALKAEAQGYHCGEKIGGDVYDALKAEMARQSKGTGQK